ncbi:MAG: hypothetical protein SGILL_001937 [Bacillariaceae sp.]
MSDFENDDDAASASQVLEDQSNSQSSKFKVFEGQTDQERREIRKKQRRLQKDMEERGENLELAEARDRNNEIFKNVRYTREAVLDGENINMIATKAAQKVDQLIQVSITMSMDVPRYDADRVVSKLIQQLRVASGGSSYFDWKKLGEEAGVCFNAVPSNITFLNGPLQDGQEEVQVKQRAARPRRKHVEEDAEEEKPEDVKGHTERGSDQLGAVQRNMDDVSKSLKRKVNRDFHKVRDQLKEEFGSKEEIPDKAKKRHKKHPQTCGVELLFNPKSFTQTVENVFHYSFLVKRGVAELKIRNKEVKLSEDVSLPPGPVVTYKDIDGGDLLPARQAIVSLNMKDWREMIKAYDVKMSDVPHRTGSKFEHETSTTGPAHHEYEHSSDDDVGDIDDDDDEEEE